MRASQFSSRIGTGMVFECIFAKNCILKNLPFKSSKKSLIMHTISPKSISKSLVEGQELCKISEYKEGQHDQFSGHQDPWVTELESE